MNTSLWVLTCMLAVAFLAVGLVKIVVPRPRLAGMGLAWTADSPSAGVKAVGVAEVLGALGLVLPAATGIAVVLTSLAAVELAGVMAGAVTLHLRRDEKSALVLPLVLGVLALFLAVGRLGPAPL